MKASSCHAANDVLMNRKEKGDSPVTSRELGVTLAQMQSLSVEGRCYYVAKCFEFVEYFVEDIKAIRSYHPKNSHEPVGLSASGLVECFDCVVLLNRPSLRLERARSTVGRRKLGFPDLQLPRRPGA
eukprot:1145086-Pelagomonas_calceolata.AAC.1